MRGCVTTLAAAGVAAAALSCLPTIPPDWLVDHPLVLGIQPVVVATGPHAAPLAEDPPGVTRADALPGDRVRLTALVADREGPLDLEALAPVWLRCADRCDYSLYALAGATSGVAGCSDAAALLAPICRIGAGAAVERRIPDDVGAYEEIMMVSGTPGGPTSEACLAALIGAPNDPADDLFGCLYVQRRIGVGPLRRYLEIEPDEGFDPEDYADADPNYNPAIDRLHVVIRGPAGARERDAHDGDTLEVAVGERVEVTVVPAAGAIQEYVIPSAPSLLAPEELAASWFLSAELAEVDEDRDALLHAWAVPPGVAAFDEYVVVRDGRASLSWASLRWRVLGAGSGT